MKVAYLTQAITTRDSREAFNDNLKTTNKSGAQALFDLLCKYASSRVRVDNRRRVLLHFKRNKPQKSNTFQAVSL
jgi:hypothetical protein